MGRIFLSFFLLFVLIFSIYCIDEVVDVEDAEVEETKLPKLIVHKKGPLEAVIQSNMTFEIVIYNVGESPAYDVTVEIQEYPDHVEFVEGNKMEQFDKVDPKSHVSMEYKILPKNFNPIDIFPAKVKYKVTEEDEEFWSVKSTDLPRIKILTRKQYEKIHDQHWVDWIIFVVLVFFPIGIPAIYHLKSRTKTDEIAIRQKKKK